jgi:hypothetical protein
MLPDGTVEGARTAKAAERIAREWFAEDLDAGHGGKCVGIGTIEWRGCKPGGGR